MAREHSSAGDPTSSLVLLWRTPGARASPSGLGPDRIVRGAIELADADGLSAVSMRRVADRLGAGTMSLYTHVPGKAELLDAMLDVVLAETARPQDVPGGWRGRLEVVARENLALLRRHPVDPGGRHRAAAVGPQHDRQVRLRAARGRGDRPDGPRDGRRGHPRALPRRRRGARDRGRRRRAGGHRHDVGSVVEQVRAGPAPVPAAGPVPAGGPGRRRGGRGQRRRARSRPRLLVRPAAPARRDRGLLRERGAG